MTSDYIAEFHRAMCGAGLDYSGTIYADGRLHRIALNDDHGKRNGWYVLHNDGIPSGAFGCWKRGIRESWRSGGRDMPHEERVALRNAAEKSRLARDQRRAKMHKSAADRAQRVWLASGKVDRHPYLDSKQVSAHGLRVISAANIQIFGVSLPVGWSGALLVMPCRNAMGELMTLQLINAKGEKHFLAGGKKLGAYHAIGSPLTGAKGEVLLLAEGYATAASLYECTGYPVAVCMDAGNLPPVAESLRKKFPKINIIVCADDDRATPGNPGQRFAHLAANACSGVVVSPVFDEVSYE